MIRYTASVVLLACAQVVAALGLGAVVAKVAGILGGVGVSERIIPYSNAHLLEEALEGEFRPVLDPIFLIGTVVVAVLAFGVPVLVATRWAHAPWRTVLVAPIAAILALGLLRVDVLSPDYPSPMRVAYIFQLVLFGVAALCFAAYGLRSRAVAHAG